MAYAALYELDLVAVEIDARGQRQDLQRPVLQQELGRLELKALGRVKHGDVPHGGQTRGLEEEP
jgi:hypothetical protein